MAHDAWAQVADVPASVPLVVCGFSMGGYVAIEMLSRGGVRPVSALGLLDSSGQPEAPEGKVVREKTVAAIERNFEKVIACTAAFCVAERRHADASFMEGVLAIMRDTGTDAAIRQNRAIAGRADHREALALLAIPTLVMCGREDRVTPPAASEALAALVPGARLEWIEGAGHMTPLEAPERVAALLRTLL
jgi:pimeloyl-ACP methyl ester carboxylesterase